MAENGIAQTIKTSVESIRSMVNANTIIGDAIPTANGTVIIPVSKLSVGFASGGIEYLGKQAAQSQNEKSTTNFGGGGGTGVSVTPVAFLIIKADGDVQLQSIGIDAAAITANDPVSQVAALIEKSPEIISGIKAVFSKGSKDKDNSAASEDTQPE